MNTTGIVCAIVTAALWSLLRRRKASTAIRRGTRHVVAYGGPLKVLGWAMLALGAFFIYAAGHARPDDRSIAAVVSGAAMAGGAMLWLEFLWVRIEYDAGAVYTHSPWRGRRVIPWRAVTGYRYSPISGYHLLETRNLGRVRLSVLLSGLGSFFQELALRNERVGRKVVYPPDGPFGKLQ